MKNTLLNSLIIAGLIIAAFFFIKGCFCGKDNGIDTGIKRDTVTEIRYITVHDTVYGKPQLISAKKEKPHIIYERDTLLIPSNEYPLLKDQYEILLSNYYGSYTYQRGYKVDTIGGVLITDTVSENGIKGRSLIFDLKYPVITNTITVNHPYKPRNQLYFGGGIGGNKEDLISQFKAGVLLKNKRDQIFIGNATMNTNGIVGGEIMSYWKLSFRKK